MNDRSAVGSPGRRWLRLYPRAWRHRYDDELLALISSRPFTWRTRIDLGRGALDAWVHPLTPPAPPIASALMAGVAWVAAGLASSVQPPMPDWPGFLLETLPLGALGAIAAMRVVWQTGGRSGLSAPPGTTLALAIALIGHVLWIAALITAAMGGPYGAITGASGAIAAIGTVSVGVARSWAGDHPTAECLLVAGGAMLIPSPAAWVVAGTAWVGLAMNGLRPVVPRRA